MPLSVSLPASDPALAGLLPGFVSPTPTSGVGAATPILDGFAGLLAEAATSTTFSPATPAATTPTVPAGLPTTSPDDVATSTPIAWSFLSNRPVSPVAPEMPSTVPGEADSASVPQPQVMVAVASANAMTTSKTWGGPVSSKATTSSATATAARSEKRATPTTEATAMALACATLPLATVAPEPDNIEPVGDEPVSADKDGSEEGSEAFDPTALGEQSEPMLQAAAVAPLASPVRFQLPTFPVDAEFSRGQPSTPTDNSKTPASTSPTITPAPSEIAPSPTTPANFAPNAIANNFDAALSNGVPPTLRPAGASSLATPPTHAASSSAPQREVTAPPAPFVAEATSSSTTLASPTRASVTDQPARQVATSDVVEGTAKIAAKADFSARENPARQNAEPRNFVTAVEKQLTPRRPDLGTDVAKPIDAMPYASNLSRPTHADVPPAPSFVLERAAETRDVATATATAPEAMSTAHRAVEAVLTAAQRYSSGEQHAVSLQFSVGGADLNVRVELRADEVRATFRTDSADLRDALSHEWNAAQADAGERPFRLAPPVFTSNDTSSYSQSPGDQAAQQQQQQRQAATRQASDLFAIGATRGRGSRDSNAVAAVASSPARAALSTALHLHTLA